jgi:RHS repeat-associated protein
LLADEQVSSLSSPGQVVWPLLNDQNSVTDLATYEEGITAIAAHRVYGAYGNTASSSGSVDCAFGYTGKYSDPLTGLQCNTNRWYDPATCRWMSKDPLGYFAGVNLYRYVGNNPTNWTDPTGLIDWSEWPNWVRRDISPGALDDAIKKAREMEHTTQLRELMKAKKILEQQPRLIQKGSRIRMRRGGGPSRCITPLSPGSILFDVIEIYIRSWRDGRSFREQERHELREQGPVIIYPWGPGTNPEYGNGHEMASLKIVAPGHETA